VRISPTIAMNAGDLMLVKAESGAELVTWDSTPGLTLTYPLPHDVAMKAVCIHAAKDGTYALTASIPNGPGTRVSICLVTVGARPPPSPPDVPVVPDNLLEELLKLYTAAMRDDVLSLAAVYREGAKTTALNPDLKTNADLSNVMAKAANAVVPLPKLEKIRVYIQTEVIVKNFPNPSAPLTPGSRTAWQVQFNRIASALELLATPK
jgi:hypothetical protein